MKFIANCLAFLIFPITIIDAKFGKVAKHGVRLLLRLFVLSLKSLVKFGKNLKNTRAVNLIAEYILPITLTSNTLTSKLGMFLPKGKDIVQINPNNINFFNYGFGMPAFNKFITIAVVLNNVSPDDFGEVYLIQSHRNNTINQSLATRLDFSVQNSKILQHAAIYSDVSNFSLCYDSKYKLQQYGILYHTNETELAMAEADTNDHTGPTSTFICKSAVLTNNEFVITNMVLDIYSFYTQLTYMTYPPFNFISLTEEQFNFSTYDLTDTGCRYYSYGGSFFTPLECW
jgi:hypothetical protein